MPRLLPRLLRILANALPAQKKGGRENNPRFSKKTKKNSRKPSLPAASFSLVNRTQSILLDPLNPITNPRTRARHKSAPPRVRVQGRRHLTEDPDHASPRSMTVLEREYWSSPYLRMLSTPLRQCIVTRRFLPSDFLIRLTPMRVDLEATRATSLLPDGLEHPQYKARKGHTGVYMICWKAAVQQLQERKPFRRFAANLSVHALLDSHIGHLLRLRVLQELEVLADSLRISPRGSTETMVLRRLTRAEWKTVRTNGLIKHDGAAAVLVVPPLNRDPITKLKSSASMKPDHSDSVDLQDPDSEVSRRPLPLSSLYPCDNFDTKDLPFPDLLPTSQVPLYNGLTLFPSAPQRAVLYAALCKLLAVERKARWRTHAHPDPSSKELTKSTNSDEKGSHAFLLTSDDRTVKRGDTAALAIALWRLRMWEGEAWQGDSDGNEGWEINKEWRLNYNKNWRI
ncbi:hypothetical protein SERLA73DRAFT_103839 [Serpula lacrymans var. lacrymans S7.3]|uniref:Uncharacterized protein n=2 Tax=Serpula lacrymans var. lacrymans TaxID=341189 RepID=F8PNS9_SERL3|nr:uncharacterized protein SERLADRAFT_435215 [Serpula lacrymans var. lacrymans S7.9]EGO01806.1 hypothetical protein SERLA73DRAFT_103839 [Serpula lacrymans var. lacrymans S7.3]EGO27438.1 hypothetical protein SERLADRAFT_435215 [Serpula lacrymans var. lacrymans S7.9]